MTKFAEPKFSVGAPLTEQYATNYERTFAPKVRCKVKVPTFLGSRQCFRTEGHEGACAFADA